MLDGGQGTLLHVRHSHREGPFSCADLFRSCRSESSAENNPNPNPHPNPSPNPNPAGLPRRRNGRSGADFPCSLDASDSNIGNIGALDTLNLNKSPACHCAPGACVKAGDTQACDGNGNLVGGEAAAPTLSLWFDSSSAGHGSSISPSRETETVSWSRYGSGDDEVGTGSCISCATPLETSRSVQSVGRFDQKASGHNMGLDPVHLASCAFVAEEGNVGTVEEAKRNCGGACMYQDAQVCQSIESSKMAATSSEAPECICSYQSNMEHDSGSGCSFPMDLKESDESPLPSVCMGMNTGKECPSEISAGQNTSCHVAFPTRSKRLRISNGFVAFAGSGSLHSETPNEAESENTNDQYQPYLPGLDNNTALKCFSFVPISALGQLAALGRQYKDLVKSRLIFKLRRMYGTIEHLVFIYTSAGVWTAYDANQNLWKTLPMAVVDPNFNSQDRESLSAGTHVLWLGKEMFDFVSYKYDLVADSWERGPSMVDPRCLFASASCGEYAYVAGGFGPMNNMGTLPLLNSAEKYNSVTAEWELLPPMRTARHKCAGFFMDGKFYVIGGKDASHQPIRSGEEYDPLTGLWREIPDMYFVPVVGRRDIFEPSPPLVAVVNNHLYAVESTTNILKMYNKHDNTWRDLGYLPVQVDAHNGWGVAFKALGNRLFLMGDLEGITAFCWQPGANPAEPDWRLLCRRERGAGSFLYNCAVMNC